MRDMLPNTIDATDFTRCFLPQSIAFLVLYAFGALFGSGAFLRHFASFAASLSWEAVRPDSAMLVQYCLQLMLFELLWASVVLFSGRYAVTLPLWSIAILTAGAVDGMQIGFCRLSNLLMQQPTLFIASILPLVLTVPFRMAYAANPIYWHMALHGENPGKHGKPAALEEYVFAGSVFLILLVMAAMRCLLPNFCLNEVFSLN